MGKGLGLAAISEARARACVSTYIPDVLHFAISNGNGEDPMVLERPLRGFDSPPSEPHDQNPVALRYEFGGLWV